MVHQNKVRKIDKKNNTKKNPRATAQPGTNIQVFLRCKHAGLAPKEQRKLKYIESDPVREVLLCANNTVYGFDRVFKEETSQKTVFDQVAIPIIYDVLKGYCCTIFAYGQTGTGKTYTMEGDSSDIGLGAKAGLIPRIINNLFMQLGTVNKDNHITVSMLELYNEELHDLLNITDNRKHLTIFDDKDLGVRVHNLKEFPISSVTKGVELMKSGIKKRMTAATNCNDKSSRSHSIFTINVYKKNIKSDGTEELISGRLNLVDLAGSENTKTAGSKQARAREAANINKSLLTLGRVINCLVERSPHIPFRESKLTRLLKDSLGGKTKTTIIATVSNQQQADDIRNTLEYASRAKEISNSPAGNFKIDKSRFEENMAGEFESLMDELRASHERNGVYVSKADFDQMQAEIRLLKEEKEALEEESQARAVAEEARVAALLQQHREELKQVQQQLKAAQADFDHLYGATQKAGTELMSFLGSRKRGRDD